jgi:hypothetical protein
LIETGKGLYLVIAIVTIHTSPERRDWQVFHDLGKNNFACIHLKIPPSPGLAEEYMRVFEKISNR